jgi:hypothetical protein
MWKRVGAPASSTTQTLTPAGTVPRCHRRCGQKQPAGKGGLGGGGFFTGFLLSHLHFLRLFSALIGIQDNDVDEIGSPRWQIHPSIAPEE